MYEYHVMGILQCLEYFYDLFIMFFLSLSNSKFCRSQTGKAGWKIPNVKVLKEVIGLDEQKFSA